MPRNASQVYAIPVGTEGIPNTTVFSGKYNTFIHDVETDLNTPRPVVAGGTGSTSADGALVNLSGEKAAQVVTNWDSTVWMPGSFYAATTASGAAPVAGHAFAGVVIINEPLVSPPTNQNVVVEARDMTDLAHLTYYRIMTAGVWGSWLTARQSIYAAPFDAMAYNGMQINGSMEVNQIMGSGAYTIDQWKSVASGPMGMAGSWQMGGPPGLGTYIAVGGTGLATLGASDYAFIQTPIEAYRTTRLSFGNSNAQPVSIGFWTAHHRPGLYSGSLQNSAATRSYPFTYNHNVADIWEWKTVTIPGDTTGTWISNTNGIGLIINFAMAIGTTFLAPANAWINGNFIGASGMINGAAAASDAFRLTGVVVLPGIELPSASRAVFIMRPFDQELQICRRYYWKDSAPSWFQMEMISGGAGNNNALLHIPYRPIMRATPTLTIPTCSLLGAAAPAVNSNNSEMAVISATSTGAAGSRIVFYAPTGPFIADARL